MLTDHSWSGTAPFAPALDDVGRPQWLPEPSRSKPLPAETLDLLTEAVACPGDASLRAAMISRVVEEILDSITWLHGSHPHLAEMDSLLRLRQAAFDHQQAMARLESGAA